MYLKFMGPEDLRDSDNRKTHRMLSGVTACSFERPDDRALARVTFDDETTEVFELMGNAYLLNDAGRTIDTFGSSDPSK